MELGPKTGCHAQDHGHYVDVAPGPECGCLPRGIEPPAGAPSAPEPGADGAIALTIVGPAGPPTRALVPSGVVQSVDEAIAMVRLWGMLT